MGPTLSFNAARMGSSNSKEKELNEDLERIRKERIAKERAERERVARAKNMDIVKAANEGRIADVKLVLQHAPEKVNDQNRYGDTALHKAAWNSATSHNQSTWIEIAEVLLAANANVDIKDKLGSTAISLLTDAPRLQAMVTLLSSQ